MDKQFAAALLALLMYQADQDEARKAEAEPALEAVEVAKAYPVPAVKAWTGENGITHIEGWISKPGFDLENETTEPEAFKGAMDEYFALGAPLTTAHQMKPMPERGVYVKYPVGHIQQAAIVRDGQIVQTASHPTDAADFEFFPGEGTGLYGRATLTDPLAADQVAKGNVRGFSWVGRVMAKPLPGGKRELVEITHWRESTIAAFPIHPGANIVAAN